MAGCSSTKVDSMATNASKKNSAMCVPSARPMLHSLGTTIHDIMTTQTFVIQRLDGSVDQLQESNLCYPHSRRLPLQLLFPPPSPLPNHGLLCGLLLLSLPMLLFVLRRLLIFRLIHHLGVRTKVLLSRHGCEVPKPLVEETLRLDLDHSASTLAHKHGMREPRAMHTDKNVRLLYRTQLLCQRQTPHVARGDVHARVPRPHRLQESVLAQQPAQTPTVQKVQADVLGNDDQKQPRSGLKHQPRMCHDAPDEQTQERRMTARADDPVVVPQRIRPPGQREDDVAAAMGEFPSADGVGEDVFEVHRVAAREHSPEVEPGLVGLVV